MLLPQISNEDATTALPPPKGRTAVPAALLAALLDEQQDLSAVDRFSEWHTSDDRPAQARYYESLLPAAPPRDGEQYAFEVDLDACSGCKACVTACHTLNGLDAQESWRDVGLLHGGSSALPVLQHVTAACHHCLDPACLNVCPVGAYEKDPLTGIVKHFDDQCFGCQYCTLACPYDVPKYNRAKGIVRKCDMCSGRLAVGEAPACVQACPHQAIRIAIVRRDDVLADCETSAFLPGAPDPQHTLPTTHYRTTRVFPRNLLPADYYAVRREHAHWPLIVMLVLTQLSVGAFLVEFALDWFGRPPSAAARPWHAAIALLFGLLALAASTLHLGRPLYAFRAVIGLRQSWLSREIVAFGLFAGLAGAYAGLSVFGPAVLRDVTRRWLGGAVVATGLAGVVCSVLIYHVTRRPFWNGTATGLRFGLTTLWLGLAAALLASSLAGAVSNTALTAGPAICRAIIDVAVLKLAFELSLLRHLADRRHTPAKRSALLMCGELARIVQARLVLGALGGIVLPAVLLSSGKLATAAPTTGAMTAIAVLFTASLSGELLERSLFFTAAVARRMPGGLTT